MTDKKQHGSDIAEYYSGTWNTSWLMYKLLGVNGTCAMKVEGKEATLLIIYSGRYMHGTRRMFKFKIEPEVKVEGKLRAGIGLGKGMLIPANVKQKLTFKTEEFTEQTVRGTYAAFGPDDQGSCTMTRVVKVPFEDQWSDFTPM
jgi:hypothetical protein